MVLSVYAQNKKREMENLPGRTIQEKGESDKDYILRMCAVNAQRCREDSTHHERADDWQRKRDIHNARQEEAEKVRERHAKEQAAEQAYKKEQAQRRKHKIDNLIELYENPGKPHDANWLRREVAPHCPDFEPGLMRPGIGILAIRRSMDRLTQLQKNGRPVKRPYGFVLDMSLMVHQGRFTHWVDPSQHQFPDHLIVPDGESPFDRRMILQDDGSWGMPDKRVEVHWPVKVPNEDGWLPGTKPVTKETPVELADIGKFDRDAKPKPFVPLGGPVAERAPLPDKPPLHTAPAALPKAAPRDPNKALAYAGPAPSEAWQRAYLHKYLPEQRGKPLKPGASQKSYGKALVETLARDQPEWTAQYRVDCFDYMLARHHEMTDADVAREAAKNAEQKEAYIESLKDAHDVAMAEQCGAIPTPTRAMREPGED